MTHYILHVSLLLGLGFLLYQVLLKKETFYSLNRVILSSYLILAFSLPLIHIPASWSFRSETPIVSDIAKTEATSIIIPAEVAVQPSEKMANPTNDNGISNSTESNVNVLQKKPEAKENANTKLAPGFGETAINTIVNIDWTAALKWIYLIGLGIFLINFLVQFSILLFYRLKFPTLKDGKFTIVEMEGDTAPFSFLNMIYINPSKYDYDTYEQILAHEKIHITKWHTLDIFLSELALIVLWFNPFAWLYRKVVEHNLEYLTDQEMLASGANAEAYQMNLLKVSVPELPLSLSTNYNQSFLKKRIHMMNAKKSSARSTWKYLFILPILGLMVTLFNPTILSSQIRQEENKQENPLAKENPEVQKNGQADPNKGEHKLGTNPQIDNTTTNATVDLSMLNLASDTEQTISKVVNGFSVVYDDNQPIIVHNTSGKTIITNSKEDIENEGVWEAELKNNKVCLHIKKGGIGKNYYWSSSECFLTTDFKPAIKNNTEGEFSLTRDSGTLKLKGEFSNNEGTGRYTFAPNSKFISTAQNQGFKISEEKLIHFFLSGVKGSFFKFLKSNGYTNVDEEELLALAVHDVNEEYIKDINGEFKKANYDQPSVEELIALKIHDVDMDYIKSFGKALYKDLTVDQIVAAAIHDVDPKFISEFKALGFTDLTFDNLIAAAIHDVDIAYVKELKSAGFEGLSFDNLIAASIHDVNPSYIRKFQDAGFKDLTFDDLIAASIHNIHPEYIKEFQNAGMSDLTFDNLLAAGIHNVEVSYIKEAKSYGFDLTFDQLIAAAIHNVDLKYVEAFSKAGFKELDFDDMITASIHNIEPEFIKEVKAAGLREVSFDDIISFGIHNVDVSDIKGFKDMGFNLTADQLIEASIHNVTPKFIKKMQDKGHKNLTFKEYVNLKIHGI